MKHAMRGNEVYKEGECFWTEIVDKGKKGESPISVRKMEWREEVEKSNMTGV